ncbi:diadenylate cyclase CdaA [Candidatus Weimeria sp. HCP3S3_B5]|uniref:diadenylate cyclase CdaA n=1 Tax=Candidatus Weimeria sp. HCP3S3_B5 TaxID=3438871 RepID=UPI002A9C78FB|nr:diadenylate cyclase CdaA [Lachnospiraceae bacterium]MDY6352417.1 diadenylate cyclase CdaA [Lachnospiraceae bacterium]
MTAFIDRMNGFLANFDLTFPTIRVIDIVEIIIIAFFIYEILVWLKNSRAFMLIRGILVIVAFFAFAALLQMNTILWLGEKLLNVAIIAIVVVFQPEMRQALEQLGRNNLFRVLASGFSKNSNQRFSDHTLNDLVKACYDMGAVKTGALIVIEMETGLSEYERTGIPIDAILSRQLLINIFEKNTPLHDGAVLVSGDRVVSATCYLPLSDNMTISKDLGTRHRAALGISEVSDAVTIVVSEETGAVSVTVGGKLRHDISSEQLTRLLKSIQKKNSVDEEKKSERRSSDEAENK